MLRGATAGFIAPRRLLGHRRAVCQPHQDLIDRILHVLAGWSDVAEVQAGLKARLMDFLCRTKDPFLSYDPTDRDGRPRWDKPTADVP